MLTMNYLVIDLEMCKVPKTYRSENYRFHTETIQIGAVLLDENYDKVAELSQYVHPVYGMIDRKIEKLTGIHNYNVKHAPLLVEALKHMIDWIGDREYKVYAWSDSDYNQLLYEIDSKKLSTPEIERFMEETRWVDYQKYFDNRYEFTQAVSLECALSWTDIAIEGRLHDGLADAMNTAKLIKKLERNPEYKLKTFDDYLIEDEEPLKFNLGAAFAGINLTICAQ